MAINIETLLLKVPEADVIEAIWGDMGITALSTAKVKLKNMRRGKRKGLTEREIRAIKYVTRLDFDQVFNNYWENPNYVYVPRQRK